MDLRVIHFMNLARITALDYLDFEVAREVYLTAPGERQPVALEIQGENFDRVEAVIVNGRRVTYTLLQTGRILARLPDDMASQQIQQVDVLTDSITQTSNTFYEFGFKAPLDQVTGPQKVAFQFLKVLMTTPGTNDFARGSGGGVTELIGRTSATNSSIIAQLSQAINRVVEEVRASQQGSVLPDNERLRSVDILSMEYAQGDQSDLVAYIRVNTFARQSLPLSIALGMQDVIANLVDARS